ncbi:sporulation protein Cse60 [Acinetobacter sp.]|uniref:sporulation protein Cse60 n=1 Tax=Acinetobacter sp. TaxID=472 RepID=UPI0031D06928
MAKVKSFESVSIQDLEHNINNWLRNELSQNNQVNIKFMSHAYGSEKEQKFTALLVYEYC